MEVKGWEPGYVVSTNSVFPGLKKKRGHYQVEMGRVADYRARPASAI
jgi:hypothetical protein